MKKLIAITMMTLAVVMVGCNTKSDTQIAQEASVEYIKQRMKNPESFKVLSVETNLDTIPPYLSDEVLDTYKQYQKAKDEADDLIPDFFSKASLLRKKELLEECLVKAEALQTVIQDSRKDTPDVQYLTCIKYNAANSVGGSLSGYSIVVASKEKPDSILGSYDLEDDDFTARFIKFSREFHGKEKFKENKYGKTDTIGFSFFEKFIINAVQ